MDTSVVWITIASIAAFVILAIRIIDHLEARQKIKRTIEEYALRRAEIEPSRKCEDGTEIIHPVDMYAVGGDFTVTNGTDRKVIKRGIVLDKPTRDTIKVRWVETEGAE